MQRPPSNRRSPPPQLKACTDLLDEGAKRRISLCSPSYPFESPALKGQREYTLWEVAGDPYMRSASALIVESWVRDTVVPYLQSSRPAPLPDYACGKPLLDVYHVAVHHYWLHEIRGQDALAANMLHASRKILETFLAERDRSTAYRPLQQPRGQYRHPQQMFTGPAMRQTSQKRDNRDWDDPKDRCKVPKHEPVDGQAFKYPQPFDLGRTSPGSSSGSYASSVSSFQSSTSASCFDHYGDIVSRDAARGEHLEPRPTPLYDEHCKGNVKKEDRRPNLRWPDSDPTKPPAFRAPLARYPPIWSQTRQEVCESFEWFRSYQGGVYFINDIAKGYLLSAFGAKRDAFHHGGKLIISHGGGRAESVHSEKGKYTLKEAEDQQASDKSVRALMKTYKERRPIALIIDDRYPLFPLDLASKNVTYVVLGFYMIVHAWAEYQVGSGEDKSIVKFKFAFQWCEGQGEPWWTSPTGMPATPPDGSKLETTRPEKVEEAEVGLPWNGADDETSMKCKQCQEYSPHVYKVSWACLNPACVVFWRIKGTDIRMPEELEYQVDFLSLRKPTYLPIGYDSLRPPRVTERDDGITTSVAFTKGYHCTECGRLSCRTEWKHWKCNTPGCEKVYRVAPRMHAANEFCFAPVSSSNKFDTEWIERNCGLTRKPLRSFAIGTKGAIGQIQTIVLPRGRGFLHHIRSNSPSSKILANDIFDQYQKDANEGDLKFRRWPMRAHKCRGALLTNYFSHNAGVPYHYVGGTENTVPFDEAPESVLQARSLIKSRVADSLKKDVDFNEVLTAAYMEKQKMAFHSDDEKGLGPLVAGLSLGSPAFMHFKLMKKYSKNGDHKRILASFILRHGDVMVMEGAGVQEYYEHTVVPTNFRIAATARFISPGFEHTQVKPIRA
ncbi:hypothetical protein BKA70DRAFT_1557921 [Coprinopsis sp. MPI-PUGE-AT-0042]|nr:hypothetical protein BKA70DRAFT_1557921 [Coprinopsis sp. MPI-PUGE-AT-0042]